jgi:hypothetical protein
LKALLVWHDVPFRKTHDLAGTSRITNWATPGADNWSSLRSGASLHYLPHTKARFLHTKRSAVALIGTRIIVHTPRNRAFGTLPGRRTLMAIWSDPRGTTRAIGLHPKSARGPKEGASRPPSCRAAEFPSLRASRLGVAA